MNQRKGIAPVAIGCIAIAVVFAVVALMAPFERTDTFWIAFAFGWVALIVAFAANLIVVTTARSAKSALYRASIPVISVMYMIVAVIVSLVFMAVTDLPQWVLIVVQVILAALCLLSLVGGTTGAALVESGEAATGAQTSFIQNMRMQANGTLPFAPDEQTRRALSDLADKLRYADPVSSPATAMVDQQIANGMAQVNASLQAGDGAQVQAACAQISVMIDQRAAICRSTK